MNATIYEMNRILNHVFGGSGSASASYTPQTTWYLGLSTTEIGVTGSNVTEPSDPSYARVAIDLYVDGVKYSATPVDCYAGSTSFNNQWDVSGISIGFNGVHEFKILNAGKNASSSGYRISASDFLVYKSA